jgi:hypothetical protein
MHVLEDEYLEETSNQNQHLISLVSDLKEQSLAQNELIFQMSIHISQLTSEKEFFQSELEHSNNQLQQLVAKNLHKDALIKQQQDELSTVRTDMNRTKTVFNKMHSQINLLKGKVEHPFTESEKVLEMEAVIEVCK